MKKLIALFLVFSLLALSGNLYAKEKRGAELVVQKKDGQQVRGELIAVKEKSLLLLDSEGTDVSFDIDDVSVITVVRRSKVGRYTLRGIGTGGLIGLLQDKSIDGFGGNIIFGVLVGGLIGAIVGAAAGSDKTILIKRKSDSEIQKILKKLSKKARVRSLQ